MIDLSVISDRLMACLGWFLGLCFKKIKKKLVFNFINLVLVICCFRF